MEAIKLAYKKTATLLEYIQSLVGNRKIQPLIQENDKPIYKHILETTIVGVNKECTTQLSLEQVSYQSDIVERATEYIFEKDEWRNIFIFGLKSVRKDTDGCGGFSARRDIEESQHGRGSSRFRQKTWKTLLERVGDDIMFHLLVSTSMFFFVEPDCYVQVSGVPLCNQGVASLKKSRRNDKGKRKASTEINEMPRKKRRLQSFDGSKRMKTKKRIRCDDDDDDDDVKTTKRQKVTAVVEVSATRVDGRSDANGDGGDDDEVKTTETQKVTPAVDGGAARVDGRSDTNGDGDDDDDDDEVIATKTQKVTPAVEVSATRVDGRSDGDDELASQVSRSQKSKELTPEQNQDALASDSQRPGPGGNEITVRGVKDNKRRRKNRRRKKKQAQTVNTSSKLKHSAKDKGIVERKNRRCKLKREKKSKSVKMMFTVDESELIPRDFILYSKCYKEMLLKSSDFNACKASNKGAVKLLQKIFPEIKEKMKKPSSKKVQRLPGYLIGIKNVLVKLLKNHRKCRYDILVHHYCPVRRSGKRSKGGDAGSRAPDAERDPVLVQKDEVQVQKDEIPVQKDEVQVQKDQVPLQKDEVQVQTVEVRVQKNKAHVPVKKDRVPVKKDKVSSPPSTEALLSQYSNTVDVYRFVRAVCHRVVPTKLWGSSHNRQQFLKNVFQCLKLGRYEKYTLKQLMFGIKVSDCQWLSNNCTGHPSTQESTRNRAILHRILRWLMVKVIMVVVKGMFYVTESTVYRNRLFYFRKVIWNKCRALGVEEYLRKGILKQLPAKVAKDKLKRMKKTPCNLKFLPKTTSLRPIITRPSEKSNMQAKNNLYGLLHVLSYIKNVNPHLLGSSLMGVDEIYGRWLRFAVQCRDKGHGKLYFVKLDIQNCFDTIKQDKLMKVMDNVLQHLGDEKYVLRYYWVVGNHRNNIVKHLRWSMSPLADLIPEFVKHIAHERQNRSSYSKKVVFELRTGFAMKEAALLQQIENHIRSIVVKIGGKYYAPISGIPQGGVLSTLLCSYVYGDMEHKYLKDLDKDGLLLRIVDDFLLVTPDINHAKKFLDVMSKGIPEYGCTINPKKTVVNFPLDNQDGVTCVENQALFPWCGMLINTQTLEVYCDYVRLEDTEMQDTFTQDLIRPGQSVLDKLQHTIQLKCKPIFMDHKINGTATIVFNLYRLFQMAASRFHCIAQKLPVHGRVVNKPQYFNRLLLQLGQYTHNLASSRGSSNTVESFPLSKPAVIWLCMKTFQATLAKHRPAYFKLLKLMNMEIKKNDKELNPKTAEQMKAVLSMPELIVSELT